MVYETLSCTWAISLVATNTRGSDVPLRSRLVLGRVVPDRPEDTGWLVPPLAHEGVQVVGRREVDLVYIAGLNTPKRDGDPRTVVQDR